METVYCLRSKDTHVDLVHMRADLFQMTTTRVYNVCGGGNHIASHSRLFKLDSEPESLKIACDACDLPEKIWLDIELTLGKAEVGK